MLQQIIAGGADPPIGQLSMYYAQFGVSLPTLFSPSPRLAHFSLGHLASSYSYHNSQQVLEGLPTFVVTAKDGDAERMALEANASSGNPYVELFISPPKLGTPLDDKSLPAKVAKWLADKAMPKKGQSPK